MWFIAMQIWTKALAKAHTAAKSILFFKNCPAAETKNVI
jgi:hypothetical protein